MPKSNTKKAKTDQKDDKKTIKSATQYIYAVSEEVENSKTGNFFNIITNLQKK